MLGGYIEWLSKSLCGADHVDHESSLATAVLVERNHVAQLEAQLHPVAQIEFDGALKMGFI